MSNSNDRNLGKQQAKITTKSGDAGTTGLFLGGKVSKSDALIDAVGSIDEAVSALGLARSLIVDLEVKTIIEDLQRDMFIVGAELATLEKNKEKLIALKQVVDSYMVQKIELRKSG